MKGRFQLNARIVTGSKPMFHHTMEVGHYDQESETKR